MACNCLSAEQLADPDVSCALAATISSFHFASLLHLPPEEATEPKVCCRARCRCCLYDLIVLLHGANRHQAVGFADDRSGGDVNAVLSTDTDSGKSRL